MFLTSNRLSFLLAELLSSRTLFPPYLPDHQLVPLHSLIVLRFLLSHARLHSTQTHLIQTLQTAETHLLLSQSLLSHLESANVYNDAFQIGHVPLHPSDKGSITVGTINGLRLGGRPVVEWDEINAGWGLVALCIDRVGVKVGCTFEGSVAGPSLAPSGCYTNGSQ